MGEIIKLLAGLPIYIVIPLAVVLVLLLQWNNIASILTEVIPKRRFHQNVKKKMELQKLFYEMEAIRKQHDLEKSEVFFSESDINAAQEGALEGVARGEPEKDEASGWYYINAAIGGGALPFLIFVIDLISGVGKNGGNGFVSHFVDRSMYVLVVCVVFAALGAIFARIFKQISGGKNSGYVIGFSTFVALFTLLLIVVQMQSGQCCQLGEGRR